MEEYYLPLEIRTDTWTLGGLWSLCLFLPSIEYFLVWQSIDFNVHQFVLLSLVIGILFIYLLFFLLNHSRRKLAVIDQEGILLRLLFRSVKIEWRNIRGIYVRSNTLYICEQNSFDSIHIEKKAWYKRLKFYQNYFEPGHNLNIKLTIHGSIISMDINELSIICEEVWFKKSGFEQDDLFTENPFEKIDRSVRAKKVNPWKKVVIYIGIFVFTLGGWIFKDKIKDTYSLVDSQVYYVLDSKTNKVEFAFETYGTKNNQKAIVVTDRVMHESSIYSKDDFKDIENRYYDNQLLAGEGYAIVDGKHPAWWKQTFDFSRYVKKNQLQKITLTSIKKPLLKNYLTAQMELTQNQFKGKKFPVKILKAN